jgi:putative glutamine amidotransferase
MCSFHPAIGITVSARANASATSGASLALYAAALEAHGARAVLLRPGAGPVSLKGLDGLLLAGGVDVDPGWYWEPPHPLLGEVDHDRDVMEFGLVQEAMHTSLPILGICRGAQVLGVALGGTLHQDIGACLRWALPHTTVGDQPAAHRVAVADGCLLRRALGQAEVTTNSFHHQANAHLGPRVRAVAWAEDGVIEGIEGLGAGFVVGVQWHPERMVAEDAGQVRLFGAFVEATRGVGKPHRPESRGCRPRSGSRTRGTAGV